METGHATPKLTGVDTVQGAIDTIEEYFARGWTDGLPIVPPTEALVDRMMTASGRNPMDVVGVVPPRHGIATIEAIAINAVMAGCRPEYMPVVVAAVEALLDEPFDVQGLQATSDPAAPLVIVSGPVVQQVGINHGIGLFGHGSRANATIGRAVRLVMVNVGGGHPETGDKSTLGSPSKYSYCIGVDVDSPWTPVHTEFGFNPEDSCVTVYAADADSQFHGPCRDWLERQRARPDAWYTTWGILYEFLRVTTHPRVMRRPWNVREAWTFVQGLLASPGLSALVPTQRHPAVAEQVIGEFPHLAGNLLHDAHTAILMREHGIRQICTRDADFHRFPFLEVVDPIQT